MRSFFYYLGSQLWSFLSMLARWAAGRGFLKVTRLPVRVVGVGNLQVGGAGKTPLVAFLAKQALLRGKQVLVLTRGYGGNWERSGGVISPSDTVDVTQTGDEAALIHALAPQVWIGIGADRVLQWERVLARGFRPDFVILDDSFQHWKIAKDLEIIALTSRERGEVFFRDWPRALKNADLVVWTKGDHLPWMPSDLPWCRIRYRLPAPPPGEARIVLVTGVADGEQVRKTLVDEGYQIARHHVYADHAVYERAAVEAILIQAEREILDVAVTGKDWVKWKALGLSPSQFGRILVLEPELEWLEGRDTWNRVVWGE